jgi:hypothetical protein
MIMTAHRNCSDPAQLINCDRRHRDVEHLGNRLAPSVDEIAPAILDLQPALGACQRARFD